jgi:hypothetical protein
MIPKSFIEQVCKVCLIKQSTGFVINLGHEGIVTIRRLVKHGLWHDEH